MTPQFQGKLYASPASGRLLFSSDLYLAISEVARDGSSGMRIESLVTWSKGKAKRIASQPSSPNSPVRRTRSSS